MRFLSFAHFSSPRESSYKKSKFDLEMTYNCDVSCLNSVYMYRNNTHDITWLEQVANILIDVIYMKGDIKERILTWAEYYRK